MLKKSASVVLASFRSSTVYRTIVITACCFVTSGCLAVANLLTDDYGNNVVHPGSKSPLIYGGLRGDLECLHLTSTGQGSGTNNMELFCLIDLPLTAVAETVCLPYLIYQSKEKDEKSGLTDETVSDKPTEK